MLCVAFVRQFLMPCNQATFTPPPSQHVHIGEVSCTCIDLWSQRSSADSEQPCIEALRNKNGMPGCDRMSGHGYKWLACWHHGHNADRHAAASHWQLQCVVWSDCGPHRAAFSGNRTFSCLFFEGHAPAGAHASLAILWRSHTSEALQVRCKKSCATGEC